LPFLFFLTYFLNSLLWEQNCELGVVWGRQKEEKGKKKQIGMRSKKQMKTKQDLKEI